MSNQTKHLLCGLMLFVYGGLVHLFLFRLYVGWAYRPPADRSFVDHPLTVGTITILGGAHVALFMLRLLRQIRSRASLRVFSVAWRGAAFGVLSTGITLHVLFVSTSILLALLPRRVAVPDGMGFLGAFILSLIGIETYGIEAMVLSLPFDLCYGLLGGLIVLRASKFFPRV